MVLRVRNKMGLLEYLKCSCGGNDFSVRGQVAVFPEFDFLAGKQLICRNCGLGQPVPESLPPGYLPPPEKVIIP